MTLTLALELPPEGTWTFEGNEADVAHDWLDKHFDAIKLVEGSGQPGLVAELDGSAVGVWDRDGIREIVHGLTLAPPSSSAIWTEIRNALLNAAGAG